MTWPVMWPVRRADVGSLGAPLVRLVHLVHLAHLVHLQRIALRELATSRGGRNGKAQARTSSSNRCDGTSKKRSAYSNNLAKLGKGRFAVKTGTSKRYKARTGPFQKSKYS